MRRRRVTKLAGDKRHHCISCLGSNLRSGVIVEIDHFCLLIIVGRWRIMSNPPINIGAARIYNNSPVSATLKITEPNGNVWEAELAPGNAYTIGRAKESDIVLNDRRVSRKHARIISDESGFKLIDGYFENGTLVRSVNHVFVNGSP